MRFMKSTGFILSLTLTLCLAACQKNSLKLPSPVKYSNPLPATTTPTPSQAQFPSATFTITLSFTPTQTSTPTFEDLTLSSGAVTTLASGTYHFNCVNLAAGSSITTNTYGVTLFTQCFTLDAGATIYGQSQNAMNTSNPQNEYYSCLGIRLAGGGGHGGPGLPDCADYGSACSYCADGGIINDDFVHPTRGGGTGANSLWNGGALIVIVVLDFSTNQLAPATINGTINMDGGYAYSQCYEHAGGGAGGAILLEAKTLSGSGRLTANGGGTGSCGHGYGGGGIISLITDASGFTGTSFVNDGNGGANGIVTITAPPTSGY